MSIWSIFVRRKRYTIEGSARGIIILKYFHIAGRERQTDEEEHRKICSARVRHYASEDFIAR